MKNEDKEQSFIAKPEVSFWMPIIVSIVTIALSYGALMARISVLENKVDTIIAGQAVILAKYSDVEARYGTMAIKVALLEQKLK